MRIAIRADGHKRIGMGHLYRMLNLARHLRRVHHADIAFISRNNKSALDLFRSFQMDVYPIPYSISYEEEIEKTGEILERYQPHLLFVDLLKRCEDKNFMVALRNHTAATVVAFSDIHQPLAIEADLVFNASIFQKAVHYQHVKDCRYFLGLDYVILPEGYARLAEHKPTVRSLPKRVFVCMGGADHHDLTYRVLRAIDKSPSTFETEVVVSSAFFPPEHMTAFTETLIHPTSVTFDPDGLLTILAKTDIAVTAGGTILIERMCAGVPGITINQLKHQAALAAEVARKGAGVDLGLHSTVDMGQLTVQFDALLSDTAARQEMAAKGRQMVDGGGLKRVAEVISRTVRSC